MLYTATILQVIIQDNLHYLAPPVKNCVIFVVAKFYCLHAVDYGIQHIWIREKTEFSTDDSTALY